MNEKKVFKKYLARYLLVMLVVVFCCIPFGAVTYRYIRDYTISNSFKPVRGKCERDRQSSRENAHGSHHDGRRL